MAKKALSMSDSKITTDYFRVNIFESLSSYNAWKMLYYSCSNGIFPQETAEHYVRIQNYHGTFFRIATNAFLVTFVIKISHAFDPRSDSLSLFKVDRPSTEAFINENKKVISELKEVRHKVFAHRSEKTTIEEYKIPPIAELDIFFQKLIEFYNILTSKLHSSSTYFDEADTVKSDIEYLFANIDRGEAMRNKEIDVNFFIETDKKASDLL